MIPNDTSKIMRQYRVIERVEQRLAAMLEASLPTFGQREQHISAAWAGLFLARKALELARLEEHRIRP